MTEIYEPEAAPAPKEWYSEEIKRLLGEVVRLTAEGKTWHDCYDNERRDNERLRAHAKSMVDALNADIDAKAAEIARLRALLLRHQVAAWCEEDSDLAVETRRALEPKP